MSGWEGLPKTVISKTRLGRGGRGCGDVGKPFRKTEQPVYMSKAVAPSEQTGAWHGGAQVQLWGSGFTQFPRRCPHLGCTGPEDMLFPNLHKGAFGLAGPETWLIQKTESMTDHGERKPLGQLPAAPRR